MYVHNIIKNKYIFLCWRVFMLSHRETFHIMQSSIFVFHAIITEKILQRQLLQF